MIYIPFILVSILLVSLLGIQQYKIYQRKVRESLGLRILSEYDEYEDKVIMQFQKECARFSVPIDLFNSPDLCKIIPVLDMKGLHLEFVKDGNEIYHSNEKRYIGSEEWQEKWRKIIFSPTISNDEFYKCVMIIMHAHRLSDIHLPFVKGSDGHIRVKDPFFIFRALYIMHYHIKIRKDDDSCREYMISCSEELKKRNDPLFKFSYPDLAIHTKALSDIAEFYIGDYIDESKITNDSCQYGLIYSSDINKGFSSLFYDNIYMNHDINPGSIIINQNKPFEINRWWNERCILTPDILALDVIDDGVVTDYLIYYLKSFISRLNELDDFESIKLDVFPELMIPIPPRSIQKYIISHTSNEQLVDTQIIDIIENSIKINLYLLKQSNSEVP